jgi:hypothetical protein
MRTLLRMGTSLLLVTAAACGGDNTGPGDNTNGDMSAKIAGSSWTSAATFANRTAAGGAGTIIALSGATPDGTTIAMAFFDAGPGDYPIGAASGTNAILTEPGSKSWGASALGGDGIITVTTLDATHVVGTFSFNAIATQGTGASGTRAVTNGSFDINF